MSQRESEASPASAALTAYIDESLRNPLTRALLQDPTRFVGVVDPDGVIRAVNDFAVSGSGLPASEYIGRQVWTLDRVRDLHDAESLWRTRCADATANGRVEFEDVYPLPDGARLVVRSEMTVLRDHDDTLIGFITVGADVDVHRRVRERLDQQERLREAVFEQSFQLMGILAPDGTIQDVNQAIARIGFTRDHVVGVRLQDLALTEPDGPERAAMWQARLDALQDLHEPLITVDSRPGPDGQDRSYECSMNPVRDADGNLELILLELRDRTDQHRYEERMRLSEEQFRSMAEALPQMAWIVKEGGERVYFAPGWQDFTGRTEQELLARGVDDLIHPADREVATSTDAAPDGTVAPRVFRMRRHDDTWRWVEARMSVVPGPGGSTRWFGTTLDITDRARAEEDARRQQEQLRATLQMTGFGTYVWLIPEDRFSRDTQLEEILGIPMESMMTDNAYEQFFSIVHAEDREAAQQSVLGSMVPGGPDYDTEFRIIRPAAGGNEERWVSAFGRTEFDERGEPIRLVGVFADITDKRLEDDARLRLQKLEAIGTLASGIAHDFNNVIGAILSYARVAEAELKMGESPATSIGEIARGAHRAGEIVQRLLTFSREDDTRRVAFDLAAVAEEARALVQPSIPSGLELSATYAPDLPPLAGDPTQLHQVVLNLLTNARQAIGDRGGHIELAVDRVTVGARSSGHTAALDPGEYLCLSVKDDGPGISAAVARRIFDPFFTTKAASDGTGLGLAAVQSIVEAHGGAVALDTSLGNGARFSIYVPTADPEVLARQVREPSGPVPEVPETVRVLFVDDEQALVRLAYRAMPYHGCEVTGFTDPREAVEAFEQAPDAFDALITDFSMPGLSGLDLTDRVRALRPGFPVVLTSGYMAGDAHSEAVRRGVGAVVPKPCSIDTLAAEVFRLLGQEPAGEAETP